MIKLPDHKCGLQIDHNMHLSNYQTAAQWMEEEGHDYDWNSNEAKQRAIDTNEVWTMVWFAATPVGSCRAAAPTLQELIDLVNGDT